MGWNPQISFKLRDDEITFGDLIFDKGSAELLCKALKTIKSGQSVGNDVIKSIIENGCYTDKELEALRQEFEEIKNDISYFKRLRASGFTSGISNWAKRVDANINYVTGSNTWIEKYKELKLCACEMYESLLGKNYEFTPQEKATFDKRYNDVLKGTTSKERLDGILRKQYYEDLGAGVPNAADIYIQAQVDNGIITEQQAEGKRKLFSAASKASASNGVEHNPDNINSGEKEVGVHVEDTADTNGAVLVKSIVIKSNAVLNKMEQISKVIIPDERALASKKLFLLIFDALRDAGLDVKNTAMTCEYYGDSMYNISADDVYKGVFNVVSELKFQSTSSLFDSTSCEVKKSDWDSIIEESGKRDTFLLTASKLEEMFTQVKNLTDGMKMIKGCVVLLNLIKGKFGVFSNVDDDIRVILNTSDYSAKETVELTGSLINRIVTTPELSKAIDGCEEIEVSWWNAQLQ